MRDFGARFLSVLLVTAALGCAANTGPYGGIRGVLPAFMGGHSVVGFVEGHTLMVYVSFYRTDTARTTLRDAEWLAIQFGLLEEGTNGGYASMAFLEDPHRELLEGEWSRSGRCVRVSVHSLSPVYLSLRPPQAESSNLAFGALRVDRESGSWDASIYAMRVEFNLREGLEPRGPTRIGPVQVTFPEDGGWRLHSAWFPDGALKLNFVDGDPTTKGRAVEVTIFKAAHAVLKGADMIAPVEKEIKRLQEVHGRTLDPSSIIRIKKDSWECMLSVRRSAKTPDNEFLAQCQCQSRTAHHDHGVSTMYGEFIKPDTGSFSDHDWDSFATRAEQWLESVALSSLED